LFIFFHSTIWDFRACYFTGHNIFNDIVNGLYILRQRINEKWILQKAKKNFFGIFIKNKDLNKKVDLPCEYSHRISTFFRFLTSKQMFLITGFNVDIFLFLEFILTFLFIFVEVTPHGIQNIAKIKILSDSTGILKIRTVMTLLGEHCNKKILYRGIMMTESVSDDEVEELLRGDWCGYEPAAYSRGEPAIMDVEPVIMDVDGTTCQSQGTNTGEQPERYQVIDITGEPLISVANTSGAGAASTGTDNTMSTTDGDNSVMGANYLQCRSVRNAGLCQTTYSTSAGNGLSVSSMVRQERVGSLDNPNDPTITKTFRGSRIMAYGKLVNQNLSATFDPQTLECVVCDKPHHIVPTDGSGFVVIVADQNFISTLSGKDTCIPIIRIEDATLEELYLITSEIFDRYPMPPGTLFLVGSVSHLSKVGTTLYCHEWQYMISKFAERWKLAKVGPIPPVLREDAAGSVTKVLTELKVWFARVYGNSIEYPRLAWNSAISSLGNSPPDFDTGIQEIYTVPLPNNLVEPGLKPWKFQSSSSVAITVAMDGAATSELLLALLDTLVSSFNCKAHPGEFLPGEQAEQEGETLTGKKLPDIIIMGGSHSKILASELTYRGYKVVDLSIPGWTPTEVNICQLEEKLKKIENLGSYVAIGDFVSNYVFRFEQDDGQLAFPYKVMGRYHMLSKVATCSTESLTVALDRLKNVMGLLTGSLICMPPLVRYLYIGCCNSEGHCEGISSPHHAPRMIGKCQGIRNSIIEYYSRKPGKIMVPDIMQRMFPDCTNNGSLATALGGVFAADGVHLTKVGYEKVADIIVACVQDHCSASDFVAGPMGGLLREKPEKFFWRGFTSPVGSKRPKELYFARKHKLVGKIRGQGHGRGSGGGHPYRPSGGRRMRN